LRPEQQIKNRPFYFDERRLRREYIPNIFCGYYAFALRELLTDGIRITATKMIMPVMTWPKLNVESVDVLPAAKADDCERINASAVARVYPENLIRFFIEIILMF
jgi:hypothetical protein